ncbi:ORF17 [Barthadenovirus mellis]|uniref:ORF17 n=1 Tax=Passerine adenovirus 1 TaxID=2779174 RepID=A0A7M4BEJ5_9ADEN|nr:ORF17 [Passerine adenovirus 1]
MFHSLVSQRFRFGFRMDRSGRRHDGERDARLRPRRRRVRAVG